MALISLRRRHDNRRVSLEHREEPRLAPEWRGARTEVFDSGRKTIIDCAHVKVERLDTHPVLFSKVFKEFDDGKGQTYDYRYWAERENLFLREFLKKQGEFTHVVQARHLISENEAAKQVLTCDAGITVANWLRVKPRYAEAATLSHPFQRPDAFLRLIRACLKALKQIHVHRIVHCDIKEDNICIPYTPCPFPGQGRPIRLDLEKLKLIDFAFSVAHSIPLTQILVIDPEERVPCQSELLISALRSDRRSGSPNAVQQLDYRVDLFSLGHMAEKIIAAGLAPAPGFGDARVLEDVRGLVHALTAFDTAAAGGPLPHDGLIAEIDRLLAATEGPAASLEFTVEGEWTAEEMALGPGTLRKTPFTPVAPPHPTLVSPPAPVPHRSGGLSGLAIASLYCLVPIIVGGGFFLYLGGGNTLWRSPPASLVEPAPAPVTHTPAPAAAVTPDTFVESGIASRLRSNEDKVFQTAFSDLSRRMKTSKDAAATAESIAAEYDDALASSDSQALRSRALGRLMWMANAGSAPAAQRVAAFEKTYDDVKQKVARSEWWVRGQGSQPEAAARWIANGAVLAQNGDRPAMLDVAFAMGHGRALAPDRAAAVEIYLTVIARAGGGDESSARLRQSALRGVAALLALIVEHKDRDAAKRLLPGLAAKADSGPADMQYYVGLMNECVLQPADLEAARQWYRKAAGDPVWKRPAEDKARLLGTCPDRQA